MPANKVGTALAPNTATSLWPGRIQYRIAEHGFIGGSVRTGRDRRKMNCQAGPRGSRLALGFGHFPVLSRRDV
jgi:hypothetical protein